MRHYIITCLMAAALGGGVANASETVCDMEIGFESKDDTQRWRAVNDGVMGGRSSGGPTFGDGVMTFQGVINTNGGGFSSVRRRVEIGELTGTNGLKLRVKTDGREFRVTMRTDSTYRGRLLSFQGAITAPDAGEWADVFVSFERLYASIFGRQIDGVVFEPAKVRELGIILADGQDGPFRIDIERIKGCTAS